MAINDATRLNIYNKLIQELEKISPPMVATYNASQMTCSLIANKPVPYGHDKRIILGMHFASIAQLKDSVAFYFFPSYMHPTMQEMAPGLYKCLKGKTCFHFRKEEDVNVLEMQKMLDEGMRLWEKYGYIQNA